MQDPTPLVTVGIPTYNRPEGFEKTLSCISQQTYRNLEIIVSDNCSTRPEVISVIKKYAENDKRITWYVQEKNISLVPNFQFLLDKATGQYFMWAADDDQWDLNFIEVCVNAMEANKTVVLGMTDIRIVGEDGTSKPGKLNRSFMQKNLYARSFHFVKSNMENKYFLCGLYRSSAVKNVPFHNSWGGEHLFLFETITKGKFLFIQGLANFYYFQGGSSKTVASIRKAFHIKSKFYFFDAYILKFVNYQFRFKHLSYFQKLGLFFANGAGLVFNEDYILYYILIKKPIKALFSIFKKKSDGNYQQDKKKA